MSTGNNWGMTLAKKQFKFYTSNANIQNNKLM